MDNQPNPIKADGIDELFIQIEKAVNHSDKDYQEAKQALCTLMMAKYEEGVQDGQGNVWNDAMYYLMDTKRKTLPDGWIDRYQPLFPPMPQLTPKGEDV